MVLYINTRDPKIIEVALKKDDKVIDKLVDHNEYGSQVLLPRIVKLLKKNKLEFTDLEAVETEEGPGSFTGLRVGASVAQTLGFVLNIPVNGKFNKPVNLRYT